MPAAAVAPWAHDFTADHLRVINRRRLSGSLKAAPKIDLVFASQSWAMHDLPEALAEPVSPISLGGINAGRDIENRPRLL